MKTILNKNYVTLTLASLLLLWSCQRDFDEAKLPETMKVSHKNFQDLKNQTKFSKALENVEDIKTKAIKAAADKTVMESQYNFTIVNDAVNVAEQNGLTSYTLLISRGNTPANELENLIVQVNAQNKVEAFIIKYTSSIDFN
jgi:hypothetical protein